MSYFLSCGHKLDDDQDLPPLSFWDSSEVTEDGYADQMCYGYLCEDCHKLYEATYNWEDL